MPFKIPPAVYDIWYETCKSLMPDTIPLSRESILKRKRIIKSEKVCVYCGARASCKDHFRPVIARGTGMPSGYCSDPWNVVPACSTCNSSKGNKHWRDFMNCHSAKSPKGRGIKGIPGRIRILNRFDSEGTPQKWDCKSLEMDLRDLRAKLVLTTTMYAKRVSKLAKKVNKRH